MAADCACSVPVQKITDSRINVTIRIMRSFIGKFYQSSLGTVADRVQYRFKAHTAVGISHPPGRELELTALEATHLEEKRRIGIITVELQLNE